jgi:DNA damage-inducible protein 1
MYTTINNYYDDIINENKLLYNDIISSKYKYIDNININVKINGINLNAIIDTGSSNTVMSNESIDKSYLDFLVDKNVNNTIYGINCINKLIGRVWFTQIEINDYIFNASVCVVDKLPLNIDIIIGCDFLKYYNFVVDFKNSTVISDHNFIIKF